MLKSPARFLIITALTMMTTLAAEGAKFLIWEGFEGDNRFRPADWDNAVRPKLSISLEFYSEGTRSLKVDFKKSSKDWINKTVFFKDARLDLSNSRVALDIYNFSFYNLDVALGFDTGSGHIYYESVSKPIKRGWNRDITFDLGTYDFKCKETAWQHSSHLKDANDVSRLFIIVYYPGDFKKATIYVDNIRFETD